MANQKLPSSSEPVKNIVLVGRTGNGKSATGNTLLGEKMFASKKQAGGLTMKCEMYRAAKKDGPIINVIDTPGLFDWSVSAEYLSKEIINCLTMAEEGIHAVLLTLSVKNRISKEEEATLNSLQRIFESKILDYVIVVFTGGDELEEEGQTLNDYMSEGCPEFLTRVLRLCGGRKILLDNKTTDKDKKAKQLNELLAHVEDVAKQNGGKPYTDNMHRKLKEENDKLREKKREIKSQNIPDTKKAELMNIEQKEYDSTVQLIREVIELVLKSTTEAHNIEIETMREMIFSSSKKHKSCNIM